MSEEKMFEIDFHTTSKSVAMVLAGIAVEHLPPYTEGQEKDKNEPITQCYKRDMETWAVCTVTANREAVYDAVKPYLDKKLATMKVYLIDAEAEASKGSSAPSPDADTVLEEKLQLETGAV